MNKKTKKRMLMLSFVFLVLWATATWASNDVLKVQSILGTAIQDIQKIYFSSWAVKDPAHPETEILMNLQNGSVHMWGRMMMAISWANDRMGKLSTWSSLFQGRNNTISWANSFLVWWSWNTIEQDATWSAILWGTSNKIIKGIASYILWGNKNTISGDNSFIIGGVNNKIEWNNSYIFGFTGVKINANNSVAFWKNIEIEKDNVFMWNGTTNKESASRENTFVMYAKNWLIIKDASNITVTKNNSTWALNVADWIMQISWEAVHCWPAIQGAIQYTWWAFGCFCGCNGTGWVSMTPTQKCRNLCPTIDGFSWDGALCKYSEYDERDSLTKAEACEAWNSSDIQEVTSSYFWEDYVSGWQWTCEDSLWGDTVSCSTKRKLVKGRCWSTLNSCAWEWVLDTTSIRFVNHKNIWECLPVWYPVYWVEGWWETNTKQICSLCEDGYKNLKDASGNWIKDSDWSIKCFKIEGTSCKNDVTITTDWNVWCTSWGVAKSTSTDANWNKTWNCESPTGEAWEKFCHTCNASANYVWSWWTTNKCVLKKEWQCGEKAQFASNNKNTWCKVWSVEVVTEDNGTNSYAWYCKWENAGDEPAFKSDLCTWCPSGKTYNVESKKCEQENNCKYTEWVTYGSDWSITVSSCNDTITIADRNVWASTRSTTAYWSKYSWANEPNWYQRPDGSRTYNSSTLATPWSNIINLCGGWYHVPSDEEWRNLVSIWNDIPSAVKASYAGSTDRLKFLNKLYLPSTWAVWYEVWGWDHYTEWTNKESYYYLKKRWGYYWTNHENGEDYLYDWVWMFDTENIDPYDGADYRNEFYVRCFANTSSSNGGSSTDYCHTKWSHHVWDSIIVSDGSSCMTIADRNVWATTLKGIWNYYMWWAISSSQTYPSGPIWSNIDCDGGLFLDCHWWWWWSPSPCDGIWSVPGKQDWLRLYQIWSNSNSSNTFWDDLELPYAWYYYENVLKNNGIWYYWTDESRNRAEAWWMVMNGSSVQFNDKLDGQFYWLQLRCFK